MQSFCCDSHEVAQTFAMVDKVEEMSAGKS